MSKKAVAGAARLRNGRYHVRIVMLVLWVRGYYESLSGKIMNSLHNLLPHISKLQCKFGATRCLRYCFVVIFHSIHV